MSSKVSEPARNCSLVREPDAFVARPGRGHNVLRDRSSKTNLQRRWHGIAWSALTSRGLLLLLLPLSVRNNVDYLRSVAINDCGRGNEAPHVPRPRAATVATSGSASKHIVVAHCKENLAWLNQLADYDPAICRRVHIHVYSKCGMSVDLKTTLPAVAECTTLHRLMNFGTQEYAYFRYIEDLYDYLPPLVSFVQGSGLTENPHLIYDLAGPDPPGLTYRSLARHVRPSWHFAKFEKADKKGEAEILSKYFEYLRNTSTWISDRRSMFTASRAQIRRNPWAAYAFINDKLARGECKSVHCIMENLFSSFFGCNPLFFDEGGPGCSSGLYANLSQVVNEEDYLADGLRSVEKLRVPARDTEWRICGRRTILYSRSALNGALLCLDNDGNANGTGVSAEANRHVLQKIIDGDTWRADLSNLSFGQRSEWIRHQTNLAAQKQNM